MNSSQLKIVMILSLVAKKERFPPKIRNDKSQVNKKGPSRTKLTRESPLEKIVMNTP